jgi:uncharacterized protein YqfB (UPF0267 family)
MQTNPVKDTFFEVFEELIKERKQKNISSREFLEGILEVLRALRIFLSRKNESLPEIEIKLQIPILLASVEAIKVFTKEYLNLSGNGMKLYKTLKELRKKGEISEIDFYFGLMEVLERQAVYLYEEKVPEESLRRIIPMFLAFFRYFYHYYGEI